MLLTSHDCFPISGGREGYAELEAAFRAHGVTRSLYASEAPGYHEAAESRSESAVSEGSASGFRWPCGAGRCFL